MGHNLLFINVVTTYTCFSTHSRDCRVEVKIVPFVSSLANVVVTALWWLTFIGLGIDQFMFFVESTTLLLFRPGPSGYSVHESVSHT
jgi:hypothetical protein